MQKHRSEPASALARNISVALGLTVGLVSVGSFPVLLHAQECVGTHPCLIPGATIPADLEGLERAHIEYLTAWHGDNPGAVLSFLAPDASGLFRSGTVTSAALENFVALAVPQVRIDAASVYLVEESDGWVTLGSWLQLGSALNEDGDTRIGSNWTVWVRGPDLRWRVVFLAALWLEAEEAPVAASLHGSSGS